jgi:hypothetical protein
MGYQTPKIPYKMIQCKNMKCGDQVYWLKELYENNIFAIEISAAQNIDQAKHSLI